MAMGGGGGGGGFDVDKLWSRGSASGVGVEAEFSEEGDCKFMEDGGVGRCVRNLEATAGVLRSGVMLSSSVDLRRAKPCSPLWCFVPVFIPGKRIKKE